MTEPLRVLILEDNPADAELAQFELQEAGIVFISKVVITEEEFVRAIQEFSPDLILSDYDLPQYTGALALAESKRRCPDTPFILVTGAVTEDRAIDILTQGAKDYVLKNRMNQRLVPAVKRALAEAEEHRARKQAEAELRKAHRTLEKRVKIRTAELETEMVARKKTEESLRRSEERQRLVLQASSIGTFEVDLLTGEGQWNATEFELLGLKPGEVVADTDTFFRFVHPDDVERLRNEWEEATRSGKFDAEFRIVRADGRECWLAGKGSFIFDGHPEGGDAGTGGNPRRFLGVNFDITERKKAEATLSRNQRTFYELIERSPFGTYIVDSDFRIAMMNASSQTDAFRNVRPIIGRDFAEAMRILWPEPVAAEIIGHFRHTLETGEPYYSRDFINPRHDKEVVEAYEWELHRMTLPGGHYGVICYYYDSTKLRQAEANVRESEESLRSLAENVPCVLMRFDRQLRVVYLNRQSDRYNPNPAEQMIGRTNREMGMPQHLCDLWDAATERVFRTGAQEEMEFDFPGPTGMRTFSLKFAPEFGPDHEVLYVLGVSSDITERKAAEEALKEANQELEAFSYSVSHDLRAPLRHLSGYAGMLREHLGDSTDEATNRYVTGITRAAKNMATLIDDLLAFSRIGRDALNKRKFQFDDLVAEVVREIENEATGREIEWDIGDFPEVYGDPSLLKLALVNLVSNAVKFTGNQQQAQIAIGCREENGGFVCFVKDNGVGFDMKYVDKLFGVFRRLHTQTEFEGTGIGLANVKRIISRHGGKTWAEGVVDQGATFFFKLPMVY